MAHAGRKYKLQFRRDLASVPNNNEGYPECYLVLLSNLAGSVGSPASRAAWLCVNLLKNDQPPMIWVSDSQIMGGVPVIVIMQVADPFHAEQAILTFSVKRIDTGVILYQFTVTPTPSSDGPEHWTERYSSATISSTLCHLAFGLADVDASAARWNIYNP